MTDALKTLTARAGAAAAFLAEDSRGGWRRAWALTAGRNGGPRKLRASLQTSRTLQTSRNLRTSRIYTDDIASQAAGADG
ncbi:hypothetical protein Daura_27070 [Dactylosporangium aurantiacum]|uniref:Uncharacterized protein n=1 Tax=Dactylosporangium aurantiacum TaxID=35754 RepID=A0A9Q9IA46_9ACTN|nr:hypothetical protein [Dactylosporangium aurantiacum]MDG6106472.1 hypothetical protein [Dactylosporangium aurantiacum]UWZ50493.1 hypothetical protein Daura_27070 [Dactylosporangium aurantiacum]